MKGRYTRARSSTNRATLMETPASPLPYYHLPLFGLRHPTTFIMARFVSHNKGDSEDVRERMKTYWQVYRPSIESMMLSHEAVYLHENDQNEIFSYLPSYQGKRVLELGAGIGRFTSKLATMAGHVTAVDFMEQYIEENRAENGHLNNVTFKCADVTKLTFPAGSFDLVFSNWLFMYLSDAETSGVFHEVLNWLKPDGHFFLRESCYHQSGNVARNNNPTLYRTPIDYCHTLHQVSSPDNAGYKIIRGKNILTYIHYHGNPNQMCFLARRVNAEELDHQRQYLDSRDTVEAIKAQERIYGHTWLSTGGEFTTRDFCARLSLVPGQRVLDVGCGTGGAALYLARQYGVHVHGVDLSSNMIHVAIERQGKLETEVKKRLQFEISDILAVEYDAESYDVIYGRDSLLCTADKDKLFKKILASTTTAVCEAAHCFTRYQRWLRPGGTLFITDLCTSTAPPAKDLLHYTHSHSLCSAATYEAALHGAGFTDVATQDLRCDAINIHERELTAFTAAREAFITDFCEDQYDAITDLWTNKIRWLREDQLTWSAFTARREAN
ncbi:Phosphoethanolamine N-methyltransferase [Chionoecetes opilio]|uniref:phosphoethanolamine N-methyltransferase n=1 Tax=Chionoecetes opilio TaxID=41210 RepID=A0A8J4XVV5_CHIOP|nr:Phosphoethanolamine N-methyltransferase [Chionoecetes opilio]